MKKLLPIFIILCFCLAGCKNNSNDENSNNSNNYNAARTASENTTSYENKEEIDLASFSTKIYIKESGRQNNIGITCSALNGTIVNSGETFSFCDTVGRASPQRGYKQADIYDSNGNVIKGYGGGNCQVSSTLYNAVLNTANLYVVERHAHSKKVTYVESRKRCCCSLPEA